MMAAEINQGTYSEIDDCDEVKPMVDGENIIDVTEDTFEFDVIQRSYEMPIVLDFWAPWCGPCRMLGPILERLAADPNYEFILAKINVDENPSISMRYQVQGIPAVKAFRDGQVVAEFVGAQPDSRVRTFIEDLAPSEADIMLKEAKSLLVIRQWADAEEAYREILEQYPNHSEAKLNLARSLLAQGMGCEAIELLQQCTDDKTLLTAEKLRPLANYLCQTASNEITYEELPPLEVQYRQTARLFERGNLQAAMDGLIDVLRQDKRYHKGEVKDVMLGIFELLGEGDPVTQEYRRELASVLF
jgi:putative thioredoxin